jgi:hypothetical protein
MLTSEKLISTPDREKKHIFNFHLNMRQITCSPTTFVSTVMAHLIEKLLDRSVQTNSSLMIRQVPIQTFIILFLYKEIQYLKYLLIKLCRTGVLYKVETLTGIKFITWK